MPARRILWEKRGPVLLSAALILILSISFPVSAQEGNTHQALRIGATGMQIGSFRSSYTQTGFHSCTVEWDFVTRGADGSFASAYNHPIFGIGLSYNSLDEVRFVGENGHYDPMLALYGSMARDLVRRGPFAFGYDLALGLSYSSGYYDPVTNGANWFFSSPVLFYAAGGGHLTWQLGKRLDLQADITVRHNSSARFAYPNGGLNYWGGGLSARYHFQDRPRYARSGLTGPRITADRYERGWSYEVYAGGGVHACAAEWQACSETMDAQTLAATKLRRWPMASLSFDALYRLSGRFALGATVNGFYASNSERLKWADGILYGEDAVSQSKGYAPLSCGIGAVQEIFYGDLAFYFQEGFYLYKRAGIHADHGRLYERAGLRYYPHRLSPFFISACIKAHNFKADYLDFTLGLRFR